MLHTKLTYKAIARMAGYTVLCLDTYYIWIDKMSNDMDVSKHTSEEDAWKYCCLDNLLINEAEIF